MRIALLADIHGNPIALDAVLADIERRGGVDGYWILGDLCAIGFDPVGVLERLAALPHATIIRGNTDRFVITGERPSPEPAEVEANHALLPVYAEVAGSFGWTQGYVEGRGWREWLGALKAEYRLELPDGSRVLLTHAVPGNDDGPGLNPTLDDAALGEALGAPNADLVCVGHFHLPTDRRLNGTRIVNPGCVSNPFPPDLRAAYALLTATPARHTLTFHRVAYNRRAALDAAARSSNPGAGYVIRCLKGEAVAPWLGIWDGQAYYPPVSD